MPQSILNTNTVIEFGQYVSAGDRFEVLKPPYAVVQQQDATPRGKMAVRAAHLSQDRRTLVLETDPHPLYVRYALTLAGVPERGLTAGKSERPETVDIDYDFSQSFQPLPQNLSAVTREQWAQPVAWAPKTRASGGTDSRAAHKPDGDWQHGRDLFTELQCVKCHRVRGEGGIVGPDLSNLIHRDPVSVLRDIREPSATLHPDYVTYQLTTKDGETIQGFIRSQSAEFVKVFDVEGKETSVARTNLDNLRPTALSLMPAGLLDGRKETDVRDLLTFLLWEPPVRAKDSVDALRARLAKARSGPDVDPVRELKIVLVASKQDHGSEQHDYPHWQTNWVRLLNDPDARVVAEPAWEWPTTAQFDTANVLVFYFWNHDWSSARLAQIDSFLARGGGMVLLHAAVIADQQPEILAQRLGLSAQPGRSGYRHMPFELHLDDSRHPITQDLPDALEFLDEPYWPLIGEPADVHLLASAKVDGAFRPLIWTIEKNRGRIVASVPGHYTATLNDPYFRLIILRAIAWVAREDPARFELKAFTEHLR